MRIPIVTTYDGRGVNKAQTSLQRLGSVAKVAAGVAAGAALAYGRVAVQAAMQDAQAQTALANTLRNAGSGKAYEGLAKYIDAMQRATGVADDELRPAFTSLFNATQNVAVSQGMLETAMATSRGTGRDLASTTSALAKALTGNRKALLGLGTGIDTTTLKTANLSDILAMLDKRFAGSVSANASTFAGKMAIVNVVAGEAAETIGGSLIDAFLQIAGDGSVEDATQAMDDFAAGMGRVIKASGWVISKMRAVAGAAFNLPNTLREAVRGPDSAWDGTAAGKATTAEAARRAQIAGMKTYYDQKKKTAYLDNWMARWQKMQDAANKKSSADALAAQKKANAEKAKALKLSKLAAKYEFELINLAAAKKRAVGAGVLGRIQDLTTLAQVNAGLPVSASAMNGAANTSIPGIAVTVNVQGSVVTQAELTGIIADELKNAQLRNGYGKWGGGL